MSFDDGRSLGLKSDGQTLYSRRRESGISSSLCETSVGTQRPYTESDACPDVDESASAVPFNINLSGIATSEGDPSLSDLVSCVDLREDSENEENSTETGSTPKGPELTQPAFSVPQKSSAEKEIIYARGDTAAVKEELEFFDIAIIYGDKDKTLMEKFAEILQKVIVLPVGQRLKVCVDELDMEECFGEEKLTLFEKLLKCTSIFFVYFGLTSCHDTYKKFQRNSVLMRSFSDQKIRFVPVVENQNVKRGDLFKNIQEIDLSKFFSVQSLACINVRDVKQRDVNEKMREQITKMVITRRNQLKVANCSKRPICEPFASTSTRTETLLHEKVIQLKYDDLVQRMDPDNGLLTVLFSNETISDRERETIKAERTRFERNEKLLDILSHQDRDSFERFLKALTDSNQDFLAQELRRQMQSIVITNEKSLF